MSKVEGMRLHFSACRGEKDAVSTFKLSSPTLAVLLSQIKQIKPKADSGFGFLF